MKPPVCHLTDAVQRTLWHHCTVHPHIDRLMKLQKLSKGIPKLKYPQSIEKCRDCLVAKLRRCARGGPEDISPTVPGQILYIDAGFMFTKSKNTARTKRLTGIHGGSSYFIIHDAYTSLTFGTTTSSKQPPVVWLMLILTRLNCKIPRRFVRMDSGGELAKSKAVKKIFQRFHYLLEPTGAHSSSQNGGGERPHQDIGNMVRVLLESANLPSKYWEYAFYHSLDVMNILPHGDNSTTPYELACGKPPDLSNLRIFGSRMYALEISKRDGKQTVDHAVPGRFLGYGGSKSIFLYKSDITGEICRATHATFDEANLDAPEHELTPSERAIWNAISCTKSSSPVTDEVNSP